MLTEAKVRALKNKLKIGIQIMMEDASINSDDDDGRALFHVYGTLLFILEEEPDGTSLEDTLRDVLYNKGIYDKSKKLLRTALDEGRVPEDLVDEVRARLDNNLN